MNDSTFTFRTENLGDWNLSQTIILAIRQMVELCNIGKDHPVLQFTWNSIPEHVEKGVGEHSLPLTGEEPYLERCKTAMYILLRANDFLPEPE